MTLTNELSALLASFRIRSARSFFFEGRWYVAGDLRGRGAHPALGPAALSQLAGLLYRSLHCRTPDPPLDQQIPHDPIESRELVGRLSSANQGNGPWQFGWGFIKHHSSGDLVVSNHNIRWRIGPGQFRPVDSKVEVAAAGAVRVAKEYRDLLPGYYMALGDADDDPDRPTVRLYWHVSALGAEHLMAELSGTLNRAAVPFRLKALKVPAAYTRTDAAVLCIPRAEYPRAAPLISQVWNEAREFLSAAVSAFVKRLAPGLGAAEDPGTSLSFGQHVSRLLAVGLASIGAAEADTERERYAALVARLRALGLDPDRPYLLPGSTDTYPVIAHG